MFGFIGRALAGVVLTKDARTAVTKARGRAAKGVTPGGVTPGGVTPGGATSGRRAPGKGKAAAMAALQSHGKTFITPERAELLQNAMKVRSAKQKILANLSDEQRAKLVGAAVRHLLRGDEG